MAQKPYEASKKPKIKSVLERGSRPNSINPLKQSIKKHIDQRYADVGNATHLPLDSTFSKLFELIKLARKATQKVETPKIIHQS